jgi:tetratricopeptide (TPR) repeat protein
VLQTPNTLPANRGRYVLLKVLSEQDDGQVYLAVVRGTKSLCVVKTARDLLKEECKVLARLQCPNLVAVLPSPEVERDGGFVMEFFPGKSLAAIRQRAGDYSLLLPPALGVIVAHDVFAAAEFFHGFAGGLRVHGNISPKSILVGYAGDVKLGGYRPGRHPRAGVDAHVSQDLKSLATLLSELSFERFPKELATLVPRLLEDDVSSMEATAAVRAFLRDHSPSAEERRKIAAWLADLFLGQREEEAQEEARLLAAGMQLLASGTIARPLTRRASLLGGTTALLALVGGGAALVGHHPPVAFESTVMVRSAPAATPSVAPPAEEPVTPKEPAPAAPAVLDPAPPASTHAPAPTSRPRSTSVRAKRESAESSADGLLHAADVAFSAGKRVDAVNLGLQALHAGGGVRAHLALGEYYRSMHRYQEAMNHYRAALEIDPENKLALAGVQLLEKRLSPCR